MSPSDTTSTSPERRLFGHGRSVGIVGRRHQWHADAATAFASLAGAKTRFITTTFVLLECGNAAARRPYRLRVNALRQTLAARGEVLAPTDDDLRAAWSAYDRGEANNAGIVDHVSFVVLRRLGLTQVFTNDRHFPAAGFEVLF